MLASLLVHQSIIHWLEITFLYVLLLAPVNVTMVVTVCLLSNKISSLCQS